MHPRQTLFAVVAAGEVDQHFVAQTGAKDGEGSPLLELADAVVEDVLCVLGVPVADVEAVNAS